MLTLVLAATTAFTSAYTELNGKFCKELIVGENGSDPVLSCPGVGPYTVEISFAAIGMCANIEHEKFKTMFCTDRSVAKLEWRLANGKPFAVIGRSLETDKSPELKKISEKLVVLGLKGYAETLGEVDTTKVKNANEKARSIADAAFKK